MPLQLKPPKETNLALLSNDMEVAQEYDEEALIISTKGQKGRLRPTLASGHSQQRNCGSHLEMRASRDDLNNSSN